MWSGAFQQCHSRPAQLITYAQLLERADAVVIGYAEESTNEGIDSDYKRYDRIVTTIAVNAILKGDLSLSKLPFVHLRPRKDALELLNGARTIEFNMGGCMLPYSIKLPKSKPPYLLFLRKCKDGRFEAITGRYDSSLAVMMLVDPSAVNDMRADATSERQAVGTSK